jgi:heme-degrading monooxygenase HmoA
VSGRVRVLVYACDPGDDPGAVERAYHRVSRDLAGVDGLLGNQLLRSVPQPDRFVVTSEWESIVAFRAWEAGADHRETTAPLRPLQDGDRTGVFGLYEVAAEYRSTED